MEDITGTLDIDSIDNEIMLIGKSLDTDAYVLTELLGATEARKKVREIYKLYKSIDKESWIILDMLRNGSKKKIFDAIREADRFIQNELENEKVRAEEEEREADKKNPEYRKSMECSFRKFVAKQKAIQIQRGKSYPASWDHEPKNIRVTLS